MALRSLKTTDTFKNWFLKHNEIVSSGVVGSLSNDADFNAGLQFYIKESKVVRGSSFVVVPDTFVTLADNEDSYVYLDYTAGSEQVTSALTSAFPIANALILYQVTTAGGVITNITDFRSWVNVQAIEHMSSATAHPDIRQDSIMYSMLFSIAFGG